MLFSYCALQKTCGSNQFQNIQTFFAPGMGRLLYDPKQVFFVWGGVQRREVKPQSNGQKDFEKEHGSPETQKNFDAQKQKIALFDPR